MVYRGKPGLGCALCRKRRLTCDRRRPSCTQCLRVNKECFGYRDPNTLRIHDQSDEVAVKARGRGPKPAAAAASTTTATATATATAATSSAQYPRPLLLHVPASSHEQGLAHLFAYYVGTGQNQGIVSFLPDVLASDPSFALQASIRALGLASISHLPDSRQLASAEYSVALLATNDALRDPVLAKADSTLAAVVLLSTYEMVTCHTPRSMHGWLNHVQGATKLLELRGEEQLSSRAGMELFTTIRFQNVLGSVLFRLAGLSTPTIAALSQIARSKRDTLSQPIETLYDMLVEMSDISIDIGLAHLKPDPASNLRLCISKALHLDAELRGWAMSLGPFWRYIVADKASLRHSYAAIYGDGYHMYRNVNVASTWNNYRQTRIILNVMIRSMSQRLWTLQAEPECLQTASQASANIEQMVADVRASIPYHLTSGAVGIGATYRLLWPLFIAAYCSPAELATKDWALKTFAIMQNALCMQQAGRMIQLLTTGERLNVIPGES